jgi:hypothetical protein
MKKILHWIKDHLPRWLDLDHDKPWDIPEKDNGDKSSKLLSKWR